MTTRPFDLVFFDLDGTLVQTAPEICDAVNDTLAWLAAPAVSQGQVERWIGYGTRELLVQALAHSRHKPVQAVRQWPDLSATQARFDQYYSQRCGQRSSLYPQVRQTLLDLRALSTVLVILTNKESRFTRKVLDQHLLTPLFDNVICGDTLNVKKPDPAGIYTSLVRWGVPPQRALFVGDSSIDAATARNAAVPVWLLPYGYNMGQPIQDCRPDRVIDDLRALLVA